MFSKESPYLKLILSTFPRYFNVNTGILLLLITS